jgi:anthranilate phosphoribosyltransferase
VTPEGVRVEYVDPADLDLPPCETDDLHGGDPHENAQLLLQVLQGEPGARRSAALLNAGAALVAAGLSDSLADGVAAAAESIDSGAAMEKLERLRAFTHDAAGVPA